MSNIYDHAYALEKSIRESDDFKELKQAFETVMNNKEAKEMFDEFRDTQLLLQEKQMRGEEITEEEVEKARTIVEQVQQHGEITQLMEAEQRLNAIINDMSKIVTKPLEELYSGPVK